MTTGAARVGGLRGTFARVSDLRRNVAANLAGRVWVTLLGFAFIPVYLKFLGIEAYGLVGVFATLQGVFGILDLGIGATINRELARLSAGASRGPEQRIILRTLEACHWPVSLAAGLLLFALAPWLAEHWIQSSDLTSLAVQRSIRVMGAVLALQLPLSFYQAALMGLQRQVTLNAILVGAATVRSVGTALVLWLISPTIEAFFYCQLGVSLVQTALTFAAVWSRLGGAFSTRPRFANLLSVWRYAAATSANSIIGISLTQLDKVLLSRLLPLEQFGYYALAATMASFVWAVAIPVNQALFPRFAQLAELRDEGTTAALYHRATQIMVAALVPVSATVALFSWHVMWLWTQNPETASQTALVASLLIAGTTMNGIASVPGYLQAAAGWPQLMAYTNLVAAFVFVPAILLVVPRFGAPGAAFVWLCLNLGYLIVNVPLMHRRLLPGEMWSWYREDLAKPAVGAVAVAVLGWYLMPADVSMLGTALWVGVVWLCASAACAFLAAEVRGILVGRFAPAGAPI